VQKDQRRPRLPLHVQLEVGFVRDPDFSQLLTKFQGGWLILQSRNYL
jgi:hypothetical protein